MDFFNTIYRPTANAAIYSAGAIYERLPALPTAIKESRGYTGICKFATATYQFANSILGRATLRAVGENIAEATAYNVGVALTTPTCQTVGRVAFSQLVKGTAFWASLGLGCAAAKLAHGLTSNLSSAHRWPTVLAILLTVFCGALNATLEKAEEIGGNYGEIAGEIVSTYGIGILTAFAGMKLFNTDEFLWDSEQIVNTYPFKTIQSMLFYALIESHDLLPSNLVLNISVGLILGSLSYNFLDLKNFFTNAYQGRLLDKTLPANPGRDVKLVTPAGVSQTALTLVKTILSNQADKDLSKKTAKMAIDTLAEKVSIPDVSPKVAGWIEETFGVYLSSLSKETIRSHLRNPIASFLNIQMEQHLFDMFATAFIQLLETHNIHEVIPELAQIRESEEVFKEKVFTIFVNALNLYSDFLRERPEFFEPLKHVLDPGPLYRRLIDLPEFLHRAGDYLNQAIINGILPSLTPEISNEHLQAAAEKIIAQQEKFESDLIGFSIFSAEQRPQLSFTIQKHLLCLFIFAFLTMDRHHLPLEEGKIRECYSNLSDLIFNYYSLMGKNSTFDYILDVLKNQIQHSRLSNSRSR